MTDFENDLRDLLNKHSMENGSNTPDFILAQYLTTCLATWNIAVQQRERWYGRPKKVSVVAMSVDPPPTETKV